MTHWHPQSPPPVIVRRRRPIAACILLCSLIAACGSDDTTGPDGGDEEPRTPACAPGEVAVAARLDGLAVTDRALFENFAFMQLSSSTFDIDNAPVDLHIDWPGRVAHGQSTPARGWFRGTMFDVGNCAAAPFTGELIIDSDGRGGSFRLRDLHRVPYCSGVAVRGSLAGCYRYPSTFPSTIRRTVPPNPSLEPLSPQASRASLGHLGRGPLR